MIVIDNAISDRMLLQEISVSSNLFPDPTPLDHNRPINLLDGSERAKTEYFFWGGWINSPADTLKKRIIQHLWQKFLPFPESDLFGFEYWTLAMLPGQTTEWHVDRGFCECEGGAPPLPAKAAIGGVYYPAKDNFEESFLELSFDDGLEMIPTRPNRLVIFDVANTYHRTTATLSQIRYSMPINIWSNNNPPTLLSRHHPNLEHPQHPRI